ncbi:uncharacterized protein LOC129952459 [Eupeodes corollae]|uniref:uncharacterized protein LOC129952459 n=1 Tax=Eupeodes corollae TaxID=290404 RepID=UPI0024910D88|nr:uncharacterized protein LOC129952459 [Eupeodes corollae]XP_055921019.1 uncharacterized protein LOC129952459 [Eupeodes corollae]XP_055921020.1 uncharacterized protein LOC129952459 [Eupeodes corollae]
MAIRFSMSEDTSHISSTSTGRKKRGSLERINDLKQQSQENLKGTTVSKKQTTNKCSNIRAMQLFYEMKQEFPNIPDDVVNHHVIDNIHDPENCKAKLKNEIDSCFVPVQSYPQQLLKVLNQNLLKQQADTKSSKPLRNPQSKLTNNCTEKHLDENGESLLLNEDISFVHQNSFNRTKCKQISTPDIKDMRSGVCSIQITTYSTEQPRKHAALEKEKDKLKLPQAIQRPTTLNLKKDHQDNDISNYQPIQNTSVDSSSIFLSSNPQAQNIFKGINTVTTIQSPTAFTDRGKSEILVNVSLSPSSRRNRVSGTQRYQSTINVRPELPFTRNLESATANNHKSYTSVNLVLRQPSANPQSPIDITVGPNLTYSSSSYHAPHGYQNNYQITVTDECGVFSAFRISPLNYNSSRLDTLEKDNCDGTPNELNVQAGNCSSLQNLIVKATNSSGQSDARKIIMRQHKQKERILEVLWKNKNKLNLVHKEIDFVMQTEISDSIAESFDKEIGRLRCDCQAMLNEIENSRKCGLRAESIHQTSTNKSRQVNSFPKYKALCYPASQSNNNGSQKQQRSFSNEAAASIGHPSTAYRDKNFNFREGD